MKVGYVRVSTAEQNTVRQEVLMTDLGVEKVFLEKVSGKNTDRPKLQEMMSYVREGDTLIVESISRFARNTKDLLELVAQLKVKGVTFISKKETIDTTTPAGEFMLTVFGAMSQLERENILQRQAEGIAAAKAAGAFTGRPCKKLDNFKVVYDNWANKKITAVEASKQLDIARSTWYRKVGEHRLKDGAQQGVEILIS